jgi:hypothetical protein
MAINTLGYAQHREAAGMDRKAAVAQAEAMTRFDLPEATDKADPDPEIERLSRLVH